MGLDCNRLLDTTIFYMIPYGLLAFLGYEYLGMAKRTKRLGIALSAILFAGCGAFLYFRTGEFQPMQIAKYPPRLYYLSYGIACSFALLWMGETFDLKIYRNRFVQYISKHSMWIYLWHIAALKLVKTFGILNGWALRLIVVYAFGILMTCAVSCAIQRIDSRKRGLLKYML